MVDQPVVQPLDARFGPFGEEGKDFIRIPHHQVNGRIFSFRFAAGVDDVAGAFRAGKFTVTRGQTRKAFRVLAHIAIDEVRGHGVGHTRNNRAGLPGAHGFHMAALFGHQLIHDGIGRQSAVRFHNHFGGCFGRLYALVGAAPSALGNARADGVFVAAVQGAFHHQGIGDDVVRFA